MFYRPVQYPGRHFSKTIEYAAIDFTRMSSIVPAFEARIHDWYITPGEILAAGPDGWHHVFSVCALDCLLIDTLAQFEKGEPRSTGALFIDYLERTIRVFATPLPVPIKRHSGADITSPAEVLYVAFRCGILHAAHIPPYAQILPEANIIRTQAAGITTYADGTDCLSVILDPLVLFAELKNVFATYVANLLDPAAAQDDLRRKFKKKFKSSFGIDITGAT